MRVAVFLILLITGMGCAKKECREGGAITNQINLYFKLPVKMYPAKDTFHIGDTLWIEQEFSDNLQNTHNGKYYTLRNFDFQSGFTIVNLDKKRNQTNQTYIDPTVIVYTGSTGWESSTNINYTYENGIYHYKAAFILDKPGFYELEFSNTRSDGKGSVSGVTECKHEHYEITFYNTDKANNNYHMLANAADEYYKNASEESFDAVGGYCFYIK